MSQRKSAFLTLVALVVSVGGFYQFVISPKRAELTKLDADIAAQEQARDQANMQATQYEKSKASYRANYAKVVQVGKAVPADDDVRSLLVQLEDSARRDKVDFRLMNVGGASAAPAAGAAAPTTPGTQLVPGSDIAMLPFSFAFAGSYFSLSGFLGEVERYVRVHNDKMDSTGRLMLLTSFSMKSDSLRGYPNLRAEVGATSYVSPPAAPIAGAESAGAPDAGVPDDSSVLTPPTTPATATGAVR